MGPAWDWADSLKSWSLMKAWEGGLMQLNLRNSICSGLGQEVNEGHSGPTSGNNMFQRIS